jgi:hypothetical protein
MAAGALGVPQTLTYLAAMSGEFVLEWPVDNVSQYLFNNELASNKYSLVVNKTSVN